MYIFPYRFALLPHRLWRSVSIYNNNNIWLFFLSIASFFIIIPLFFCSHESPLYDWKAMEKDGFSWWIRRLRRAQDLFDEFRIDHFRGFAGFWVVPSGEVMFNSYVSGWCLSVKNIELISYFCRSKNCNGWTMEGQILSI